MANLANAENIIVQCAVCMLTSAYCILHESLIPYTYSMTRILSFPQGVKFLRRLKFWLNPAQVFDLAISGPDLGWVWKRYRNWQESRD